ncbi:MAG: hypothetical protein ABEL76_14635 [Bradymonadaceae bacterium]
MRRMFATLTTALLGLALAASGCESSKSAEKEAESKASKASKEARAEGKKQKAEMAKKKEKMKKLMKKMMKADKSKMPADKNVSATVTQPEGKVTYWVPPGPRELGDHFGTKDNPKFTGKKKIQNAPPPVKKVLKKHPILVGAPPKARKYKNGKAIFAQPTPFSDKGVPVKQGSLDLTYIDRRSADKKGPPIKTPDEVKASISFTDPDGNSYKLKPLLTFQPPIPGYKTQGGVMTDDYHHGATGTGSPLMPKVYTWGAFWAIGNVVVNGEVANKHQVMHCMTTETVRDKNYHLTLNSEMPLKKSNTIAGQMHHTHCIVLPIKFTPTGPVNSPVNTAFELPNGKKQPFIHIMYENDKLGDGPSWNGPSGN